MKKFIIVLTLALVSGVSFAQVKSSVIKNTAGTEVFSIAYTDGAATTTVNGVVSATTLSGALGTQASITLSGATGIVSTAAALAAPTNTVRAGLRVLVNGTNYVIALYPN